MRLALSQIESKTYLRNQLLRDSDWASMDHSVELRTPLVDAWLLRELQPVLPAFKRFPNKRLFSETPAAPLDRDIVERRKTGFLVPVQNWLAEIKPELIEQGMSRGWARTLAPAFPAGSRK
jgi:asparagine synthase (glutamine-hydrolysing)